MFVHLKRVRLSKGMLRGLLLSCLLFLGLDAGLRWYLPSWLKPILVAQLTELTGRHVTLGELSLHPWQWQLSLRDFALMEKDSAESALTVGQLQLNLSFSSLWHRALVVDAMRLDKLKLGLVRHSERGHSFDDVVERILAQPASPEPVKFFIEDIVLRDLQITVDDRFAGGRIELTEVAATLPFLSNFPKQTQNRVTPMIAGRCNGAVFKLEGEALPFAKHHASVLRFALDGLDLSKLNPYLPSSLGWHIDKATLDADLAIHFEQSKDGGAEFALDVSGAIEQVALFSENRAFSLGMERFAWQGFRLQWPARQLSLKSLALSAPLIKGRMTGKDVPQGAAATGRSASGNVQDKPWQWSLAEFSVDKGGIEWVDERLSAATPATTTLREIKMNLQGLQSDVANPYQLAGLNVPLRLSKLVFSTSTDLGEQLDLQLDAPSLRPSPGARAANKGGDQQEIAPLPDIDLALSVQQLALNRWQGLLEPWLPPLAQLPVKIRDGRLSVGLALVHRASASEPWQLRLTPIAAKAGFQLISLRIDAEPSPSPLLTWPDLQVQDLQWSGALERFTDTPVKIIGLQSRDLNVKLQRDQAGQLNVLKILTSTVSPAKADPGQAKPSSASMAWQVEDWRAEGTRIDWQDDTVGVKTWLDMHRLTLSAHGRSDLDGLALSLSGKLAGQGAINAELSRKPDVNASFQYRLQMQGLPLTSLRRYVSAQSPVDLAKGQVDALLSGHWQPATSKAVATANIQGDIGVRDLYGQIVDASGDAERRDLFRLKQGSLKGMVGSWRGEALKPSSVSKVDGSLPPAALTVKAISLDGFFANLALIPPGRLHFANLVGAQPSGQSGVVATVETQQGSTDLGVKQATGTHSTATGLPIKLLVEQVEMRDGRVHFADFVIQPNYRAQLTNLRGSLRGLSSEPDAPPAELALSGAVDGDGVLDVSGKVAPFRRPMLLDIAAKASDLELTRLTSYAEKYAGYAIEKGKLSLTVNYLIEQDKLRADHRLFLDQLTFGDRVDSPSATSLPVMLAVSLLKNRRGEIDVRLPVQGTLDDPEFSIGGVIVRMVLNVVTKAVTSPFALLGELFSGGEEDWSALVFPPGRADLSDLATSRLQAMAKALQDRPGIKVDIAGYTVLPVDDQALREQALQRRMIGLFRQQRSTEGGDVERDDTRLIAAFEALSEADRDTLLRRVYEQDVKQRPRNALGFSKAVPPVEMRRQWMAVYKLDEAALRDLAMSRASAVRAALEQTGLIAPERLFLLAPKMDALGVAEEGKDEKLKSVEPRVMFSMR